MVAILGSSHPWLKPCVGCDLASFALALNTFLPQNHGLCESPGRVATKIHQALATTRRGRAQALLTTRLRGEHYAGCPSKLCVFFYHVRQLSLAPPAHWTGPTYVDSASVPPQQRIKATFNGPKSTLHQP